MKVIPTFTQEEIDAIDLLERAVLDGTKYANIKWLSICKTKEWNTSWGWLNQRNCEKLVNPRLLESYSQAFARYIKCEEAISQFWLLGKHPTTGGVIASPIV